MKRLLILLLSGFWMSVSATPPGGIKALFSHNTFFLNGERPFVETYLMVNGSSVVYQRQPDGQFQGTVEVSLVVYKNDQAVYADKYNLLSPLSSDSVGNSFNFIDQQRIAVDTGLYSFELSIRDVNSDGTPVSASDIIRISHNPDKVSLSGVTFIEKYTKAGSPGILTKGGYDLVPHISEFFGPNENELTFYAEVYNTAKVLGEGPFLVTYFLESAERNKQIPNYTGFRRFNGAPVCIVMNQFDIGLLPGGKYNLVIEVRNSENQLVETRRQEFVKSNPALKNQMESVALAQIDGSFVQYYQNADSLAEHIRSLQPVSTEPEKIHAKNVIGSGDISLMRQYFLTFWLNRDETDPQHSWEKYRLEVRKVNKEFSTSIRKGYTTDRGRVYLQYGPPDNRVQRPREPSAYPYEIWQYYKLEKQSNRRFVFYNRDLVTNDYELIHSDALGEIMNDQWQLLIHKRDTQTNDIDQTSPDSHWGTQLQQDYQAPR